MAFTGNENHSITLTEASEWTENYRNSMDSGDIKAHFFGQAAIAAILAQTDCVGIRIYYALDGEGTQQLIIVGVNEDEDDLYDGLLAERSVLCPPKCSTASPLNS